MSKRRVLAAAVPCVLSACFATHPGQDDPSLRDRGRDQTAEPDASRPPAPSAAADAASGGVDVWIGAAHREGGVGLAACGPPSMLQDEQARALLLLELDADARLVAGSLTLGEGPPLPPVEDPDAYYPPEPPWDWHGCPMLSLVPGFEYALHDARLVRDRLTASIHPAEVVKPWCELQPSYPASPVAAEVWGEYLCRPTDHVLTTEDLSYAIPDPSRNTSALPPFVPEELCFNVNAPCLCDADSCSASPYGAFHLDLQAAGDAFSGVIGALEIKLERAE